MTEGELTDDQRPRRGLPWYEDRTSLLDDAYDLQSELSEALYTVQRLTSSPRYDESYKVRASRIGSSELRALKEMGLELNRRLEALELAASKTWKDPEEA